MLTIGRKIPRRIRAGDYVAMCDQCGANYYRSQLKRKPGGALLCLGPGTQNDFKGKDEHELAMGNAEGASSALHHILYPHDGGNFDYDAGI